jgi:hypothetical protein
MTAAVLEFEFDAAPKSPMNPLPTPPDAENIFRDALAAGEK